ncbi:hypothetical protein Sd1012_2518 [Shigella dysenteriae 1012]|nr:hypothetical protein Sd1012_2518 [Shigella dysenteriae 1012]
MFLISIKRHKGEHDEEVSVFIDFHSCWLFITARANTRAV